MNRIDRLTAILIQLQSQRVVKAQDIAERFSISLRTVYRDIRTLEEGGIPIIGEAGLGYSIMDGYRLPPVMFTKEEATAFLTAEKLIEKLTDTSIEESYKSAMYKIKAVLRVTEKDYLENIDAHIEVLHTSRLPRPENLPNPIHIILKSISEKNVLSILYFSNNKQEKTERNVEPVGIFFAGNRWHLIAFCHLRNDYRDFRIDRIIQLSPSSGRFMKEHPSLKTYLKQLSHEQKLETVVMKVDKKVTPHFGEQLFYNGFVSQQEMGDNIIEMTFLSASLEGFARWYMMFGDYADIVSPDRLKDIVRKIAVTISEK